jgi:hypothetical protein
MNSVSFDKAKIAMAAGLVCRNERWSSNKPFLCAVKFGYRIFVSLKSYDSYQKDLKKDTQGILDLRYGNFNEDGAYKDGWIVTTLPFFVDDLISGKYLANFLKNLRISPDKLYRITAEELVGNKQ